MEVFPSLSFPSANTIAAYEEDRLIAVADLNGLVRIYRILENGPRLYASFNADMEVQSLSFNGKALYVAGISQEIFRYDLQTGDRTSIQTPHRGAVNAIATIPGSEIMASASSDWAIAIFKNQKLHDYIEEHASAVNDILFSTDSRFLVSAENNHQIIVRQTSDLEIQKIFTEHESRIKTLAFSPDSRILLSGDHNGGICVFDLVRKKRIGFYNAHDDAVSSLSFINNEQFVSCGFDGYIRIWNLRREKDRNKKDRGFLLQELEAHPSYIIGAALFRKQRILFTIGRDSMLRFWRITDSSGDN